MTLFYWLIAAVIAVLCASGPAQPQGYQCRTSPVGASTAYCASEAFVTASRGTLAPQVFSSLATCNSGEESTIADVTDSTTAIYGETITGGGGNHVLAYCNGTNWTVTGGGTPVLTPSSIANVRLTLTQGVPVTTADVTGAMTLYLEPYGGSQLSLYDGVSSWTAVTVAPSTYSLPATQTQSGTTHTNTTIDGLTDTSQLVVGMQVSGTDVAANTTITAINSLTSVSVNNATTGSTTTPITFALAPNTNYDVWAYNNGGVPKLLWSNAWTNITTPADARGVQDGVLVKSADHTRRLLGTVTTLPIAGQLEDSSANRTLSNLYKKQRRPMVVQEATLTWTYSTATFRQANGNGFNKLSITFTVPDEANASVNALVQNSTSTARNVWVGIGLDSSTVPTSAQSTAPALTVSGQVVTPQASYLGFPGLGYHTLDWLEDGAGADTQTWYGTGGAPAQIQTGIVGTVMN